MYSNSDEIFESFSDEQKEEYYKNFKLDNDPRVTKIGDFLRRTSLDEIPQLANVLKSVALVSFKLKSGAMVPRGNMLEGVWAIIKLEFRN